MTAAESNDGERMPIVHTYMKDESQVLVGVSGFLVQCDMCTACVQSVTMETRHPGEHANCHLFGVILRC